MTETEGTRTSAKLDENAVVAVRRELSRSITRLFYGIAVMMVPAVVMLAWQLDKMGEGVESIGYIRIDIDALQKEVDKVEDSIRAIRFDVKDIKAQLQK